MMGVLSSQTYFIEGAFCIESSIITSFIFLLIFAIIQEKFIQILFFSFFMMKKYKILHSLPKFCKITLSFNLILVNEVTVGANHKFFTLTLNGLKAIPANEGNHVESLLIIAISTCVGNNYECL